MTTDWSCNNFVRIKASMILHYSEITRASWRLKSPDIEPVMRKTFPRVKMRSCMATDMKAKGCSRILYSYIALTFYLLITMMLVAGVFTGIQIKFRGLGVCFEFFTTGTAACNKPSNFSNIKTYYSIKQASVWAQLTCGVVSLIITCGNEI